MAGRVADRVVAAARWLSSDAVGWLWMLRRILGWVDLLDAAYWVCALVLVVSGASKLSGGSSVGETLAALGLPAPPRAGAIVGIFEVLVGGAALLAPHGAVASVVAVLVALTYAVFAVVVHSAMRAGLSDCGCIGVRVTPPSTAHVVFNVVAAAIAATAAVTVPVDLLDGLTSLGAPWSVIVGAVVAVTGGALAVVPGR